MLLNEILPITDLTEKQRRSFSCGVHPLDDYFKQYAKNNHIRNIGKTFVLVEDKDNVIGYYTTSMGVVDFLSIPREFQSHLPKYPIPVARIGWLAVSVHKQRQGWGAHLLVDALQRIQTAALCVAAYGIIVDAKDVHAKNFYLNFGFTPFLDNPLSLFLSMNSIPSKSESSKAVHTQV